MKSNRCLGLFFVPLSHRCAGPEPCGPVAGPELERRDQQQRRQSLLRTCVCGCVAAAANCMLVGPTVGCSHSPAYGFCSRKLKLLGQHMSGIAESVQVFFLARRISHAAIILGVDEILAI